MSRTTCQEIGSAVDQVPEELVELKERIQAQPAPIRAELEPLVEDVLEHARFRGRAMMIAKDALERFRLDLAMLEFDLEVTRREREALKARLEP
jgi:hypothetical protein